MAAMVLATFRLQYPEFGNITDDAYVQLKLDQAESHTNAEAFGDHFEEAHGIATAMILWDSPFGATMRLDGKDAAEIKSLLQKQFERLVVNVIDPSLVVTGDSSGGCACDDTLTCF